MNLQKCLAEMKIVKYQWIFLLFSLFSWGCQKGLFGSPDDSMVAQSSQEDCGYIQNSWGARVSWKNFRPVQIQIDSEVPPEFHDAMIRAAEQWNTAIGKLVIDVRKPANGDAPRLATQDSNNGIFWFLDWDDKMSQQQAVTTVYYKGNLLNESDVKINAKNFTYYVSEPNSNREVHMESLMIHEFGHFLGLKHLTVWPTVMWPTLAGKVERTTLSAKDLEDLKCEY